MVVKLILIEFKPFKTLLLTTLIIRKYKLYTIIQYLIYYSSHPTLMILKKKTFQFKWRLKKLRKIFWN